MVFVVFLLENRNIVNYSDIQKRMRPIATVVKCVRLFFNRKDDNSEEYMFYDYTLMINVCKSNLLPHFFHYFLDII